MALVRFASENLEVEIDPPMSLQELCAEVDCDITFGCRSGTCGTCRIRIDAGAESVSKPSAEELDFLQGFGAAKNERLGCQIDIQGDLTITYVGLDDLE